MNRCLLFVGVTYVLLDQILLCSQKTVLLCVVNSKLQQQKYDQRDETAGSSHTTTTTTTMTTTTAATTTHSAKKRRVQGTNDTALIPNAYGAGTIRGRMRKHPEQQQNENAHKNTHSVHRVRTFGSLVGLCTAWTNHTDSLSCSLLGGSPAGGGRLMPQRTPEGWLHPRWSVPQYRPGYASSCTVTSSVPPDREES